MKWIKSYNSYKESIKIDLEYSNIKESLNVWYSSLLSAIDAEEQDIYSTLHLPIDDFKDNLDIDFLSDNIEFINSLTSIGLKKSSVENTETYETFLNKPCKFMLLFNFDSNELENPEYILFQNWNETTESWSETRLYKVNEDIKRFYDKLTSKTVEIIDGDNSYIYSSDNAGNEWVLQNIDKQNDTYKKVFRDKDFDDFLTKSKSKIVIR
jgi:hypothetical protein